MKPIHFILLALMLQSTQTPSAIEGVVVRFGTFEPVPGVDLELVREGTPTNSVSVSVQGTPSMFLPSVPNPADVIRARTKADGRFRFPDLKAGTYRLLASHADGAFCPSEFGQKDLKGPGLKIVLSEGESFRKATVEMTPPGTISGRVVDENGNPAGRVRVMAIDSSWRSGKQSLGIVEALYTDDHGEYRLFWLPPGRYLISANPVDPRRQSLGLIHFLPGTAQPTREYVSKATVTHRLRANGEMEEEVVDAVYHGGGTDPKSARAIELGPGANVSGIDISLNGSRGHARRIRGTVVDAAGRPVSKASVAAIPHIDGPSIVMPEIMTAADGSFALTGVGPGSYVLRGIDRGTAGANPRIGQIPIPPGEDNIENITLVVTPGFDANGRLVVEGPRLGEKEDGTTAIRIALVADNMPPPSSQAFGPPSFGPPGTGALPIDGAFTLTGIQPGDYHLRVSPILNAYTGPPNLFPASAGALQNYYVKSIRLGPADVLNDGVHVDRSIEGEFEIVLGSNGGVLEGEVAQPGNGPVANATVFLIPDGLTRTRPDLYKNVNSDRSGHYSIRGIAPGDYRLFAWERIEDGIWFDPDFMRANRGKGTVVHIVEGDNAAVNLSVVQP